MKNKKVSLTYGRKKFIVNLRVCKELGKFIGLMFKRREKANALLFEFDKSTKIPIHSLFVFFPFVAIWLNEGKIVDLKLIKPFNFSVRPKGDFDKLIEIPINDKYAEVVELLHISRR